MPLRLDLLETRHGLPPGLLSAVRDVESGGDPSAVSPKGARGAFQFMPATARQYEVDPFDPEQAAAAAARMFGELSDKYGGDVRTMLAGYNWGQGNVDRKGMDAMPSETRNYIRQVSDRLPDSGGRDFSAELYGNVPRETKSAAPAGRDFSAELYGPPAPTVPTPHAPRGRNLMAAEPKTPPPADHPTVPTAMIKVDPSMAEDDIIRAFGYDPALIKSSAYYRPDFFKNSLTDPKGFTAKVMDSQLGAAIRGLRDPVDAGAQLLVRGLRGLGLRGDAEVAFTDLTTKLAEADYQQNWRHGGSLNPKTGEGGFEVSRLVGNMLVPLPMGKGQPVGTAAKVAVAAARGAIAGLSQPVVSNESDPEYAATKLKQGVAGAILAPVVQAVGERFVEPLLGKTINAVVGRRKPNAAVVEDLGRKYGVDLTVGDVSQNPLAKKTEVALESLPGVGMTSRRITQQGQVAEAVTGVVGKARQEMLDTPFTDLAAVQKAAASTGPRANAARNLLTEAENAGEDWATIIQTSGGIKSFRTKLQVDDLYNEVEQIAAPLGNVPVSRTLEAVDSAISEASTSKIPDTKTIGFLQNFREALIGKVDETALTDPVAQIQQKLAELRRQYPGSIFGLRVLEKEPKLGDRLSPSYRWSDGNWTNRKLVGASTVGVGRGSYDEISEALNNLGAFGKNGPNGYYFGDTIALVRGMGGHRGQDVGEKVIKDPFVGGIWKKADTGLSSILPNPTATTANNTFSVLRQARSDLGATIADLKTGDAALSGTRASSWLSRIKDALSEDMNDFAQNGQNPALSKAWRRADKFYREEYVPYKDRALAKAFTDAYPDEIYKQFIRRGAYGDRAEFFFKALDEKGRAAVRFNMIQDALQHAQNETARGTIAISPRKFAAYLEHYPGARSVIFKGEDKWALDGFMNLMTHVERAGQYAENPPTGQRLMLPFAIASGLTGVGGLGGALGGGSAVVGGAGTAGVLALTYGLAALARPLFTSKIGKRILLAASDLPAGSPKFQRLIDEINEKILPRAAGTSAGQAIGQTEGGN